MTKKDFDHQFIENVASNLDIYASSGMLDKPMVQQNYNDLSDSLCKSGDITEYQRSIWCTPKGALNLTYLNRFRTT